jgi:hypothetical protein
VIVEQELRSEELQEETEGGWEALRRKCLWDINIRSSSDESEPEFEPDFPFLYRSLRPRSLPSSSPDDEEEEEGEEQASVVDRVPRGPSSRSV